MGTGLFLVEPENGLLLQFVFKSGVKNSTDRKLKMS